MRILFFILAGLAGQTGETMPETRLRDEVLRDLRPFLVLVEGMPPNSPVTKAQLQTDVELRLRSLGIEVSPKKVGAPFLLIRVGIHPMEVDDEVVMYCHDVEVSLYDLVVLMSETLTVARIWYIDSLGCSGLDVAKQAIREYVADDVDKFANAWLKTHPKKPATGKTADTTKP